MSRAEALDGLAEATQSFNIELIALFYNAVLESEENQAANIFSTSHVNPFIKRLWDNAFEVLKISGKISSTRVAQNLNGNKILPFSGLEMEAQVKFREARQLQRACHVRKSLHPDAKSFSK